MFAIGDREQADAGGCERQRPLPVGEAHGVAVLHIGRQHQVEQPGEAGERRTVVGVPHRDLLVEVEEDDRSFVVVGVAHRHRLPRPVGAPPAAGCLNRGENHPRNGAQSSDGGPLHGVGSTGDHPTVRNIDQTGPRLRSSHESPSTVVPST